MGLNTVFFLSLHKTISKRINKEFYIVNMWVLIFSKDNKHRLIREECVGSECSYYKAMGSIMTQTENEPIVGQSGVLVRL